jgi:hypothetical protein
MSKEVDERVVSLEFNNQNFEKNVSQSMRTIDSLNNKLNLPGASRGLETVSKAASNVDLTSLSNSVSALEYRFSTMGIVGATAISNITTKLMQFSSKTLNFLTNGIVQGGIARAMKVETARFQLNGLLKDTAAVEDVMKNVKASVDGTAYSMDAAASVASQLAASGMRAGDDMLNSLKAVAGVAAMTNSSYEDIGRIFTQVAGQGRLMGDQLLQFSGRGLNVASTLADYLTKVGNGAKVTEAQVRDMVSKGKIDFNTFSKAMSDAFSESAFKANETVNGTFSNIKAALAKIGESFVAPLVKSNGPLVNLLNALREKVNIVKDKLVGKDGIEGPLTKAGNKVGEIINKVAGIIKGDGFSFTNSAWDQLSNKITEAGVPLEEFQNKFKQVAKAHNIDVEKMIEETGSFGSALTKIKKPGKLVIETLKELSKNYQQTGTDQQKLQEKLSYLQKMVDETWRGDWGNQPVRQKLMEQAGHNYQEIQELVNKTVDKHRLTQADLNEETLKSLGYTEKQIDLLGELAKEAEKSGTSMNELLDSLNKPSKSFLIFDTFSNVVKGAKTVIKSFKDALEDAFTPLDKNSFTSVLVFLHDLSEHFVISDENAEKLTRTFKGLFAVIDLIGLVFRNTFGAAFQLASKVVLAVADALGITCDSLLDFTAVVGDGLVALRDWCKEHDAIGKAISGLANIIADVIVKVIEFVKAIWQIPAVQNTVIGFFKSLEEGIKKVKEIFDKIHEPVKKFIDYMKLLADSGQLDWSALTKNFSLMMDEIARSFGQKDWNSVGQNIAAGIAQGIKNFTNNAVNTAVQMAKNLFDKICTFFDIHSPSKKMEWVGEMTMQGFINGLKNAFGDVTGTAQQIVDKFMEIFNKLTLNDLLIGGGLIVGISAFYKISKSVTQLIDSLSGPMNAVTGVLKSVSGLIDSVKSSINMVADGFATLMKANATKIKSEALLNVAKAIVALAGALIALSMVNADKLKVACAALVTVTAALAGLAYVTSKVGDVQDFGKISVFLISMGAALTLMASAIKKVSKIEPSTMIPAVAALAGLMVVMGLLAIALAQFGSNEYSSEFDKAGKMFIEMGIALKLMASAIKTLSKIDQTSMTTAAAVLSGIAILMTLMATVLGSNKVDAAKIDSAGNTFMKMAVSLAIIAIAIKMISGLSPEDCIKGVTTLGAVGILFTAYAKCISTFKGEVQDAGSMLMKMAVAIGIMALTIRLISGLSVGEITKGIVTIALFEALCVALVAVSKYSGEHASKAGSMLMKMSIAIGIMALTIRLISGLSVGEIVKGVTVIALFEGLCVALIAVSKFAGQYADKAGTMLLKVAAAIGILVLVIRLLSDLEMSDIVKGIAVIGAVGVVFALLINVSQFAGRYADRAGTMLMKMTVPILALALAISLLSVMDSKKVAVAAASMSAVMGMFALIAKMASIAPKGLTGLLAVSVVVAELAGILYLLNGLDSKNVIATATGISVLMLSMSVTMGIMALMKGTATAAIPSLVTVSAAMVIVAALIGVMQGLDIVPTLDTIKNLSAMMLSLSAMCVLMAGIGLISAPALVGVKSFLVIIGELAAFMTAIGALVSLIPQLETFLDKGVGVLDKIGSAIGSFFGNIVGGFLGGASSTLPEVGVNLSTFMIAALPFFNGLSKLDSNVATNAETLAKAILALTGSGVLSSLVEKFTGIDGMDEMAESLPKMGKALADFSSEISGDKIDSAAIQNASSALQAFAQLSNSLSGFDLLVEKITGMKKLDDFSGQLGNLATGLVSFQKNLGDTPLDSGRIESATSALQSLSGLSGSLDNMTLIVEKLTGKGKLDDFSGQLGTLATGLAAYCKNISNTNFDTEKIDASIAAAKSLSALSSCTSTLDQFIGWITGKGKIDTLGDQLQNFGKALKDYCSSISDGKFDAEKVQASASAAKALADLTNSMPSGDDKTISITQFAGQIETLGTKLASYCNSIADVDFGNVNSSADAIKKIAEALKGMGDVSSTAAKTFADSVNALAGADIKGFVSTFEGVDTSKLSSVGKDMMTGIASGIKGGAASITSAIKSVMSSAANSAKGSTSSFKTVGSSFSKALASGIKSGASGAKTAARSMAKSAASSAKARSSSFRSAGLSCAEGFASGIAAGQSQAIAAAVNMAAAAYAAAKKKLDVNSPSKLFRRMAICVPEGFAQGIVRGTKYVIAASEKMANTSIDTTENALNKIASLNLDSINTDPTIRPVVDLSNVSAGADKIASMLNLNPSVGLAANLGAINSAMNSRNQNDSNQDVINALRDVKRAITKSAKPTYNINGITYDDGSNVSNAVSDLVRAVKIEGRV